MSLRAALPLLFALALGAIAPLAFAAPEPAPAATASATAPAPAPATASASASASASTSAPAAKGGLTQNVACSVCHSTESWKARGAAGKADPGGTFDHATTGFPLTGQHVHASCVACHDASRSIKRACVSCHADTHRGRLSQSCDQCHNAGGWKNVRPLEIHRMTRFPLTGMHALADCTECHKRASEHQFVGTPADCFTCHEKDYRRATIRPVHTGTATTAPFPRDCSLCHKALAWVPARVDPALLTGTTAAPLRVAPPTHEVRFPIATGVHRGATCDDCHASTASPRMVRCNGCHAHDPVRLVQQHKKPVSSDGASCLSCHPGGTRR